MERASGGVAACDYYGTKDTILEIYEEIAEAMKTGKPYQARLDQPEPAHLHPPREATKGVLP